MRFFLSITFIILVHIDAYSQDLEYANYTWEESPVFKPVKIDEDEHEVIIKDKRAIEFAFDYTGAFSEYYLKHRIIYIGTDKAIEANNKLYIPSDRIIKSIFQRARVVSKDGKITELDDSDILEAKDEDGQMSYKYFALEGVEIGSFVEYMYLIKKRPAYTGKFEVYQGTERRRDISFDLISPDNLIFKTKSYNQLADTDSDGSLDGKNRLYFKMAEMSRLKDEQSAANVGNYATIVYKLDENTATGASNITSYNKIAPRIYSIHFPEFKKKTTKELDKLIEASGANKASTNIEKIRLLEDHIKTNFGYYDGGSEQLADVESILENKVANDQGFTSLMANLFKQMNIKTMIVLTSPRDHIKFDPEFEAYNFLRYYLIYFPDEDNFIAPSAGELRYGFVPAEYTNTYGLFIPTESEIDPKYLTGSVRFIKPLDHLKSTHNLFATVDLMDDVNEPTIYVENHMSGYYAQNIQTIYELIPEENQTEVNQSLMEYISGKEDLKNLTAKNTSSMDFGMKPFIVTADFTTSNFTEKAGPKVLFKVGELIGQQMEMYNEDERKQDVESEFNRKYYREITIKLPEGYQLSNPEIMKYEVLYKDEEDIKAAFTSNYTIENGEMKIVVEEYYTTINYPKERFDDYTAVINAAADFNKKVLVFEK